MLQTVEAKKSKDVDYSVYLPEFRPLNKVKTIYYAHDLRRDVVGHGVIIGLQYFPKQTCYLGWWYKVLIHCISLDETDFTTKKRRNKIDLIELEGANVIEVYEKFLKTDNIDFEIGSALNNYLDVRVQEFIDNHREFSKEELREIIKIKNTNSQNCK
jgi:hypothetical protein